MPRPLKTRIDPGTLPQPSVGRELWEGVFDALRDGILAGSIPAGSDLVEGDLAARFGVSRGPVRDALRELAREGLVVDLPRRGTVVSVLTLADVREVYEVREGLEITAATLVVSRARDVEIAELATHLAELERAWLRGAGYDVTLDMDLGFHRALVALAGNRRLAAAYDQMLGQTRLLIRTIEQVNPHLGEPMRPSAHRDILQALAGRDVDRVRDAITDHYEYAKERLLV